MPIRSAITGAAILAALFFCVWGYGQYRYEQGYSSSEKEQAVAIVKAYEKVREIELQHQAEIKGIRKDASQKIEQIEMDRDSASTTSERLRKELARYRANSASACSATRSPSAKDPIGMLIGVLEGLESTGREIAEYADRARIAGAACEQAHDVGARNR